MNVNIFEYASKNAIRFPYKGMISTEDLWQLNVSALDSIYKALNKIKKESDEESLLQIKSKTDIELEVKIEIVKYIVAYKLAEKEKRELEAENKKQKQKILEIIAKRQDTALENMSDEELNKKLLELEIGLPQSTGF